MIRTTLILPTQSRGQGTPQPPTPHSPPNHTIQGRVAWPQLWVAMIRTGSILPTQSRGHPHTSPPTHATQGRGLSSPRAHRLTRAGDGCRGLESPPSWLERDSSGCDGMESRGSGMESLGREMKTPQAAAMTFPRSAAVAVRSEVGESPSEVGMSRSGVGSPASGAAAAPSTTGPAPGGARVLTCTTAFPASGAGFLPSRAGFPASLAGFPASQGGFGTVSAVVLKPRSRVPDLSSVARWRASTRRAKAGWHRQPPPVPPRCGCRSSVPRTAARHTEIAEPISVARG